MDRDLKGGGQETGAEEGVTLGGGVEGEKMVERLPCIVDLSRKRNGGINDVCLCS